MSDFPYATRLRYEGYSGIAKRNGDVVELAYLPQFLPYKIVAVDYIPAIVAMVMPYGRPWQDMTEDECLLANQLLRELV